MKRCLSLAFLLASQPLLAAPYTTGSLPRLHQQVDPLDDSEAVYVLIGDGQRHVALGCQDTSDPTSLRALVKFGKYIGEAKAGSIAGGTYVHYRFDDRPTSMVRWHSDDDTAVGESDRKPLRFIQEMRGSSKAFFRAQNYSGDTVDALFIYQNPSALIDQMLALCGVGGEGSDAKSSKIPAYKDTNHSDRKRPAPIPKGQPAQQ